MNAFMADTDAFAWYMERDPTLRSTIVGVAWFERSPDWDTLVAKVDRATRLIPMFRQCVVEPPGRISPPRWTSDDTFDISWHLRRVDSPVPHTPATVVALARNAAMTAFDHAHPLWEFTLVERLEGGRAALVMKVHHALTDGVGGMQLALELFDLEPTLAVPPANVDDPDRERLGTPALLRASLARDCDRVLGFAGHVTAAAVPAAWRTTRHPRTTTSDALETVRSIGRTVAPVNATLSPIMQKRSIARRLDMLEVRLADLKRAAAGAGGSLNDGFMAAVTGGLRRYHEHHDAPVEELRVTLPISLRTPADAPGGNHITLIRFAVPVADPDPAARIRKIGRLCHAARTERSLEFTGAIAGALNLLPPGFIGSMLKRVDFVASDIPGFPFPVYLAGARMERYVAFGPTTGTAVNLSLLSYHGACCVGITMDAAAITDPDVLVECIRQGFEEVLDLGGDHERVRLPLREEHLSKASVTASGGSRESAERSQPGLEATK